jgi:hypothetical protein
MPRISLNLEKALLPGKKAGSSGGIELVPPPSFGFLSTHLPQDKIRLSVQVVQHTQ